VILYRSPSVQFQILASLLSTLLNHTFIFSLPCIIVGDFNEDILHQTDSRIVSFMSTHRYTQLVNTPTTARGTLIDHVYCNGSPSSLIVQVQDTYYSDHDTVYCSIPV
jgi:endonuclease/exonuclease/phosphatase (EEP) superfamily protein YafD